MPVAKREPQFVIVPAGARPAHCSSCGAEIYWVITGKGRRMPVDCNVPGGQVPFGRTAIGAEQLDGPDAILDGKGISHFATCPQAAQHRKPR